MKKRLFSVLLSICMFVTFFPGVALVSADTGSSVDVATAEEFKEALGNDAVTEINVTKDLKYGDDVNTTKRIVIPEGITLSLSNYTSTATGTFVINGTVAITGRSRWYWKANISGSGKLVGNKDAFNNIATFVDYGCAPEGFTLESCMINIVKDLSTSPTITFPKDLKTGDYANVTVTNLFNGMDCAKVFKFSWKDRDGSPMYDGNPNPVLTDDGTLKLTLTPKSSYIMLTESGSKGSIDGNCTVALKTDDTIYVNADLGKDDALGAESTPVKTVDKALAKVSAGGTIVLQSDCSINYVVFDKNVTLKSAADRKYTISNTGTGYTCIKSGITVTTDTVELKDVGFRRSDKTDKNLSVIFKNSSGNVTASNDEIDNITLNHSSINGTLCANNELILAEGSVIGGRFSTPNLTSIGDGNIYENKDRVSVVSANIKTDAGKPITIIPDKLERGVKLIEVPAGSDDSHANNFKLQDASSNYALKCRKGSMYTYIGVSEAVSAENGFISVFYEPQINHEIKNDRCRHGFGSAITADTEWKDNTAGKKWMLGDVPKLIVKLSANDDNDPFSHFDATFDINKIKVYTGTADNPEKTLNDKAVCSVEDGQGISANGRVFTFTITYPEITKLNQNATIDESVQEMNCGQSMDFRKPSGYKGRLTYTSDNPDVVSVEINKGQLVAHKPGEATITVGIAETDTFNATQLSYKVKVTHKYSSEWKSDKTDHWKECGCGDKTDIAAHTESDWIIDTPAEEGKEGSKHKECTECKYVLAKESIPALPYSGGGSGGTVTETKQYPEAKVDGEGGKIALSDDGTTAVITPDEGYEIASVSINGVDKGAIDKLTGLKTGDKIVVTFARKVAQPTKEELDSKVKEILNKASGKLMITNLTKTSRRITVMADLSEAEKMGYKVKYTFYKKAPKSKAYKAFRTTTSNKVKFTKLMNGTHKYKVQIRIYDADGKLVASKMTSMKTNKVNK